MVNILKYFLLVHISAISRGFVNVYPLGDLCTYIPPFGEYAQIPPNGGIWVYIPPKGGIWVEGDGQHHSGILQDVPVEATVERRIKPSFNELFCNQQTLWKDNNWLIKEFIEFMRNKN